MPIPYKVTEKCGRYVRVAFSQVGRKKYTQLTLDRATNRLIISATGIPDREVSRDGRGNDDYIAHALLEYGDIVHSLVSQQHKHPENANEHRVDLSGNMQLTRNIKKAMGLKKKETDSIWQD